MVLVKKTNGKWRIDLNKAYPKDNFSLSRIDQLVNATVGHELLTFMDAYLGYNQIKMYPTDQEHISFITKHGLFCYKVMSFGLKNVRVTCQRMIAEMFASQVWQNLEVYVDDMPVKSHTTKQHEEDLSKTFYVTPRITWLVYFKI